MKVETIVTLQLTGKEAAIVAELLDAIRWENYGYGAVKCEVAHNLVDLIYDQSNAEQK